MNSLKTLRSHWKKSVFAVCVSAYGIDYLKGKYKEWILMKEYCIEAKKHGELPVSHLSQPRKVSVILNPASNKGSGRDSYKKKVAPLLHLAGFEVDVILTKHEGHGKKIMNDLDSTNAIVIAAGDGTVSEVVTGLMKRADEQIFSQTPICVAPLGKTNTLANLLHPTPPKNNTQFVGEMVMALVNATALKYVDVFSVQAGEDRKVYGVGNMSIGAFTDSQMKRNSWYHRLMAGRVGYILTSLFGWQDLSGYTETLISYSNACNGCNNCKIPLTEKPKRWWSFLLGGSQKQAAHIDYTNVLNGDCGKVHCEETSLSQLDLIANVQTNSLIARFIENNLTQKEFINLGLARTSKSSQQGDKLHEHNISSLNLELTNLDAEKKVQIDSETYDMAKTLSIQLLPNKLKFFFNPNHYTRNVQI